MKYGDFHSARVLTWVETGKMTGVPVRFGPVQTNIPFRVCAFRCHAFGIPFHIIHWRSSIMEFCRFRSGPCTSLKFGKALACAECSLLRGHNRRQAFVIRSMRVYQSGLRLEFEAYSQVGSVRATWPCARLCPLDLIGDYACLLYTSPSPRDRSLSRMPSSA